MDQRFVMTNEGARHPFRRRMPAFRPDVAPRGDDHDLKLFVLSFTAFFICFYTFIM